MLYIHTTILHRHVQKLCFTISLIERPPPHSICECCNVVDCKTGVMVASLINFILTPTDYTSLGYMVDRQKFMVALYRD